MQQNLDFSAQTIEQINVYHQAELSESKTDGSQVKLTPTQKTAISHICREHNVPVSAFLRDALDLYLELFPYREKIRHHKEALVGVIKSLA